jgi:dolichol kinase
VIAALTQRKLLHLATATVPVAWAYGVVSGAEVRNVLTVAAAVAVSVELLRCRSRAFGVRFDALVGRLLKPHEREGLTGATWLILAMLGAVTFLPSTAARAALWAGAVGDAAAALAGTVFSRRDPSRGKTLAGAAACAVATTLGAWWLAPCTWGAAVVLGAVAAAAEWPARWGDDNLRVTLATGLAAWLLRVG